MQLQDEAPAVNHTASFTIEGATSAKLAPDSNELSGTGSPRIIGNSAALRRVLGLVRVVAPTDATVLITGETGTGKELIAEAIHKSSNRSNGPFVKVNCAAIPAGLLESELFGHERGAYTGAVTRSIGRFERAGRGTLFLDEIGDLPLELQPKLLRFMQDGQFERLGGPVTLHTDVRVICATHRNLIEMVDAGQFRADLFYRLSVFPIALPALRERREDILLLVHHFAMHYAARLRKRITAISEDFMAVLARHSWPGNIRELQNFVERSVILSTGVVLSGSPPELSHTTGDGPKASAPVTGELAESSDIPQSLQQTEGVIGGRYSANARLGLPRTTSITKVKRPGIKVSSDLISEDPIPLASPMTRNSHDSRSTINPNLESHAGRVCTLAESEREHISGVLQMTSGLIAGKGGAAEVLGLPASTLRSRMKKLGIKSSWRS
jgi:formate hydrogenlyase transcriptional activator